MPALKFPEEVQQRVATIDQELVRVDSLASRWASGTRNGGGSLHPLEALRLMKDGAVLGGTVPPMPDDVLAFDQVYASSPARTKSVVEVWYRQGGSAKQKARRLNIARATLYLEWKTALSYFRGRLHAKGFDL